MLRDNHVHVRVRLSLGYELRDLCKYVPQTFESCGACVSLQSHSFSPLTFAGLSIEGTTLYSYFSATVQQ